MKARELRIGNWVHNSINNQDFQIDCFLGRELCTNVCEFDSEEFDSKIKDLQPIPLTEEWLLNFGYQIGMFWILSTGEFRINISGIHYDIQYVHQLQNLYFALTGGELTLKP
jgi:hypothetical protein